MNSPIRPLLRCEASVLIMRPHLYYRICPGMQYSEATLFITFARILHALVIERANCDSVPDRAIPSSDDVKMKEGFISCVSPE